jgi:hypothetical protein
MREMVPTAPKNVKTCTHAGMLAKALCMCVRQTEYTLTLHARARAHTHTHTIIHNNRVHAHAHAHAHSPAQSSARHAFCVFMYIIHVCTQTHSRKCAPSLHTATWAARPQASCRDAP